MNIIPKYCVLTLLILNCAFSLKAQLTLENPSFEADSLGDNSIVPMYWHSCYQNNCGTFPVTSLPYYFPPAVDGNFYGAIGSSPSTLTRRSFSAMLSCKLFTTSRCSFSFYSYCSLSPPPPSPYPEPYDVKGFVKVWLGNDSCVKSQLIYQSGILDEVWFKNVVPFTPNDNYQFIYFEAEKGEDIPNAVMSYIFIDAISPITVSITSKAKIEVSKVNDNCFNLQSTIDADIQALRYEWKNKWGIISNQSSIENICIDKPTTIYFKAYDACGYSYTDSVILVKDIFFTSLTANETNLQIEMIKQNTESSLLLYNTIGQLVSKTLIAANTSQITLSIETLSSGMYSCCLISNGIQNVKRFIKRR